MTNITALLLVLTLTGTPVATSVVCVAECQQEPATSDHCHGDMAMSEGPMMAADSNCNNPSISERPYLIEHRAVPGAAVLTATLSPTAPDLVRADAPAVLARAAAEWLKAPRVLRL